ncbi:NAD(P)/FAD-dependent oxidoreductase [Desulfothermobacter acidiphilus]|uniref:NAD(P)/FAD-dependent oxidoreductase n=1 Tax=Desulfothermobacter acidiphilus TaxID=1938353 RepID=UPI003F8B6DF9
MPVKKRIVIVGGGFAGHAVFYGLRPYAEKLDLVLVEERVASVMKPELPEVAFAGYPVERVFIPLRSSVEHHGGRFVRGRVVSIAPAENRLFLQDGAALPYDYLILGLGAIKDYDAIPGFREYGHSLCDEKEAPRLAAAVRKFPGGRVVIGAAPTRLPSYADIPNLDVPCEGPVGEAMFMVDYELRRRRLRETSAIDVFTPGTLFFADVGPRVHEKFAPLVEERGIRVHSNKEIQALEAGKVRFADGSELAADLAIVIPPYKGQAFLREAGLGDELGFVYTDLEMRHPLHRNIYAVGDVNARAIPKLGHLAVMQGKIAAASLLRELFGAGEVPPYRPEVFCIMDRGGHEASVILSDVLYGGSRDVVYSGPFAKVFEWSFDSFYYFTYGHVPPEFLQRGLEKLLETFSS